MVMKLLPRLQSTVLTLAAVVVLGLRARGQGVLVSSPAELRDALDRGEAHIVVTAHLDLRSWRASSAPVLTGTIPASAPVQSLRGGCTSEPSFALDDPPLEPLRPGQCIVVLAAPLLTDDLGTGGSGPLWLDNIYARLFRTDSQMAADDANPGLTWLLLVSGSARQVWVTNSALQADGASTTGVVSLSSAKVLLDGVTVMDTRVSGSGAGVAATNATAAIDNSVFLRTAVVDDSGGSGGAILTALGDARAALLVGNNVTFRESTALSNVAMDPTAAVYAGPPSVTVLNRGTTTGFPSEAASAAPPGAFLSLSDAPFLRLQEAAGPLAVDIDPPAPPPSQDASPPRSASGGGSSDAPAAGAGDTGGDGGGDGGGGSSSAGPVIGGIVAGVVVIGLLVLLAALALRRRRRRQKETGAFSTSADTPWKGAQPGALHSGQGTTGSYAVAMPSASGAGSATPNSLYNAHPYSGTSLSQKQVPEGWEGILGASGSGTATAAEGGAAGGGAGGPITQCDFTTIGGGGHTLPGSHTVGGGGTADSRDKVEALEDALDKLHEFQVPYVGRYVMHSSVERRAGGQGVVQFAHAFAQANREFAIKFYTEVGAFARERDLYSEPALRAMMPATHEIIGNEGRSIRMPDGFIFPPAIVIEKGESLDVWARRETHDFITIMQVLCHVAERLLVLHQAGWAHRDIKPGNVLRRPVHHSWTLIDFGCTARIGETVPLSFSPGYAPPEVVGAYQAGEAAIVADPAADMWALGIIAYEMLTKQRAYGPNARPADMLRRVAEEGPLPWEDPAPAAQARLRDLRGLKRTVLQCLDRDPRRRPTSDALLGSWNRMFDNTHSVMLASSDTTVT